MGAAAIATPYPSLYLTPILSCQRPPLLFAALWLFLILRKAHSPVARCAADLKFFDSFTTAGGALALVESLAGKCIIRR